jgi:uncharacterized protein YeaO (DUF488 family)
MSRHTLNDGVTPDPAITEELFDRWWPEIAPPAKLIGAYCRQEISWEDFEREFLNHLKSSTAAVRLRHLAALSRNGTITILCVEPTPEHCHRRLVAEACRRINPLLDVIIE